MAEELIQLALFLVVYGIGFLSGFMICDLRRLGREAKDLHRRAVDLTEQAEREYAAKR